MPNFITLRISSLRYGALLPFQALGLILKTRALLFWSALPIGLTLAIYSFVITRAQGAAKAALLHQLALWGWSTEGFAATILVWLTRIILLLIGALTFSVVASVAASPFNDFLAEHTESFARPALPAVSKQSFTGKLRLVFIDLGKSLAAGAATLLALLLSWVPVVNIAAFAIAFLLVTFQYISYPQTRRGHGLGYGVRFLLRYPWTCLAFGGALSFLFAIPLISAFAMPLAVVGGTLLVAKAQENQLR